MMNAAMIALAVLCAAVTAAAQIQPIRPPTSAARVLERVALAWGWFGPYNNNEIAIASEVEDPPMLWLVAKSGTSLGSLTFGRIREDGRFEAMVLIQGKQDERTRGLPAPYNLTGELTIHIRNGAIRGGDDAQFVKVLQVRHDGIWAKGISPD